MDSDMPLTLRISGTFFGALFFILGWFMIKHNRELARQLSKVKDDSFIYLGDEPSETGDEVRACSVGLYFAGGLLCVVGLFAVINAVFDLNLKP